MWLLNTRTYELQRFESESHRPRYAILSHVWRDEEITMQDMQDLSKAKKRKGFRKIEGCCKIAKNDGYDWVWIDTCCIDKTSSAELSEAINSMYRWYGEAEVCYAYLFDARDSRQEDPSAEDSSFRSSRWFTRGWTLQELIAPKAMFFLAKNWERLGTRRSLVDALRDITMIDRGVLLHEILPDDVSIARRMSWASHRETTRVEDRAYSLMGIFNVNMPTIYGEGEKAFIRLQLEIIRQSPDQSIFAWGTVHSYQVFLDNIHSFSDGNKWSSEFQSLLASDPRLFAGCETIEPVAIDRFAKKLKVKIPSPEYSPSNYGIHIHLPLYILNASTMSFALLACKDRRGMIGLLVRRKDGSSNQYYVGLHGMHRPMRPPWHPHFRVFHIPEKEPGNVKYLTNLEVSEMFLHSHNTNPQRSRALGIADKQLRIYHPFAVKRPEKYSFIIDGWLLKQLREMGFRCTGWKGEKEPGWTPSKAWSHKRDSLLLNVAVQSTEYRQAVVLFRGPHDEAFALTMGVTKTGFAWAEGLVKGCRGSEDGDWEGSSHDAAKKIWTKYNKVEGRVKDLSLERWRGSRKFGDVKKKGIKVTFKPWLAERERRPLGNGTVTYTVEFELIGSSYMELATPSATSTVADAVSDVAVAPHCRTR